MTETARRRDFPIGSLVRARGRDWVVLPGSDTTLLVLRPLGGGDDDVAGVLPGVEEVTSATFAPPRAEDLGDYRSARLLRDALRIGFRSTGGPFRCLAGLAVSPRPYQIVPLLLALRHDTVRLLIADDVGIGKTVEAGLVAAELLAQGSARGLTVLCPPSLAAQWQQELREKFGMDAELVLPGTARRLERGLVGDESVFTRHPITVVSTDFIKSERRRHEFLRAAPDLVVVDEAHGSAGGTPGRGSSGRTQRYQLLQALAADRDRHLVLVTATPHSGNEDAFRNLIGLLDESLRDVDLTTEEGRRRLANHFVQRRRPDVRSYLAQDTQFPKDRQVLERSYTLSPAHRDLFDATLEYVRGQVRDTSGTRVEQRVRWWSALSLLRALASSPAAAAETLATRSASAQADTEQLADELGRSEVLDLAEDDALDSADATPGGIPSESGTSTSRVLGTLRRQAEELRAAPEDDAKLTLCVTEVKRLLQDGYHPVVFCRFLATAHYVTEALRERLRKVDVEVVTGELDAGERAGRVKDLVERAGDGAKALVATDCLSEGVNLQDDFQAVVHYDLTWNPTRHEQREGRVDRFGQPRDVVRALLLYGKDTGIDGIILDVLLRKHEAIRKDLGVSIAVPPQSDQVLEALIEGILLRGGAADQLELDLDLAPEARRLEEEWRSTAEAERRSRTRFAQAAIHPEEVQSALESARAVMGEDDDVADFVRSSLTALGAVVRDEPGGFVADVHLAPIGLRDALTAKTGAVRFVTDLPKPRHTAVLHRTDTTVAHLARFVLDGALDPALPDEARPARRCGLVATDAVTVQTFALLLRVRTHVSTPGRDEVRTHVAEEARVVAFTGPPSNPEWLDDDAVAALMTARPRANVDPVFATAQLRNVIAALPRLGRALDAVAADAATQQREAHAAVRRAARGDQAGRLGLRGLDVVPQLPVDVLGVYVFRPVGGVS